jgi:hypothetical protein
MTVKRGDGTPGVDLRCHLDERVTGRIAALMVNPDLDHQYRAPILSEQSVQRLISSAGRETVDKETRAQLVAFLFGMRPRQEGRTPNVAG